MALRSAARRRAREQEGLNLDSSTEIGLGKRGPAGEGPTLSAGPLGSPFRAGPEARRFPRLPLLVLLWPAPDVASEVL